MPEEPTIAPGFVGYDKRGRFLHFCHCGAWGAYGYHVKLLAGQLGEWYCAEHRPFPGDVAPMPPPQQPRPVDDNRDLFEILRDEGIT